MNKHLNIISNFFVTDIWRIKSKELSGVRSFFIKHLRVIILALRGFLEDKCQLRASALTFYSLLSIVPVAAMAFGIAKGFGFEKILETQIMENFSEQQDVMVQVITFAKTLLENTKGGLIAGIGVAILFWTVIKVLGNIESSFNDIWGIKESRSFGRKFSDYLSIMLICPILLIASSSITVFISTQIHLILDKAEFLGVLTTLILFLLKFLPYCISWVLFTFIYIFMPNTKVNFMSGLLGGIVAGTTYAIVQWFYIYFQVGVAKYNAIYGSFAALPLFLMWLQLSWLVVLLGAEISFARQNEHTYEFEPDCMEVSDSFKRRISLEVTQLVVKRFSQKAPPLTSDLIAHKLEVPIRLVRQLLFELVKAGVLSEAKVNGAGPAYLPAKDINILTIQYVLRALDRSGRNFLPQAKTVELENITSCLEKFQKCMVDSPANKLLKDI